jgi:hypothetical protein
MAAKDDGIPDGWNRIPFVLGHMTTTRNDNGPWGSLAQIGKRYYWVMFEPNVGQKRLVDRVSDGFVETREEAERCVAGLRLRPGWQARALYRRYHMKNVWRGTGPGGLARVR